MIFPALILLLLGTLIRGLWLFWTPKCNESCPSSIGIAMYAVLLASILFFGGISAFTAVGKIRFKLAMLSVFAGLLVVTACALAINFALGAVGYA